MSGKQANWGNVVFTVCGKTHVWGTTLAGRKRFENTSGFKSLRENQYLPTRLAAVQVSSQPSPCHPSVPGFPTSLLPATATYATLRKERRMQLIDQGVLDRKSGEAEGSAVRSSPSRSYLERTRAYPARSSASSASPNTSSRMIRSVASLRYESRAALISRYSGHSVVSMKVLGARTTTVV
jgi:hypothetical protein